MAFGPVPSRRLGRSLGINNIPPKVCTYSCIYCQVGRTIDMQLARRSFYRPEKIKRAVQEKVERLKGAGESIDYLTFVPDGEPTLDINLGREIDLLKPLGIKIAVISNNSLICRQDVREDLFKADLISLKIDSAFPETWHRMNRPIKSLHLPEILDASLKFAKEYKGKLITEMMLVRHVNDNDRQIRQIADFLVELQPAKAYLSIPTRPPALKWVRPPDRDVIDRAYKIFHEFIHQMECMTDYEGNRFTSTDDIEKDLLSITAVHPLRKDAVDRLLTQAGANWEIVEKLIAENRIAQAEYEGQVFYKKRMN
ncbi:MAG: radical SAM protein [Deltaproteobacteria bacterium]|nr:radical SAM protein [Deltaproteobacteria bacterium]MBW2151293.1 radical SAM protein [Deltaproteobacteria bacterium]